MRKVEPLVELQRVDTALDRARERLKLVVEQLSDRSALADVEAEHAAAEAEASRLAGEQRDLELEIQDLRGKLSALEKRLYSGSVMNPKELDAMTKDAQQFRSLISTREDRLIGLYDEVEAADQRLADTRARLEAARTAFQVGQRALSAERDELVQAIGANENLRETIQAQVEPATLRVYESLRRTRGGLAVAEVAQRTCQGCRVSLPAHEVSRVRTSEDLVFCQSCGRILHSGS